MKSCFFSDNSRGKTTISMIRATRDCRWEQGSRDSSTNLHLATSPNEHHGVAPRAVRSNWDHSWGSTLRVKMTWNAREGFYYCFIMSSALIIQQTVEWTEERGVGSLSEAQDSNPDWHQLAQWLWANLFEYLSLRFSHLAINTSSICTTKLL